MGISTSEKSYVSNSEGGTQRILLMVMQLELAGKVLDIIGEKFDLDMLVGEDA